MSSKWTVWLVRAEAIDRDGHLQFVVWSFLKRQHGSPTVIEAETIEIR